jgi:hypothetical protein
MSNNHTFDFTNFLTSFPPDRSVPRNPPTDWLATAEMLAAGVEDLLTSFGGCSFRNGMYRLHTPALGRHWSAIVGEAFPKYRSKVYCFGYDWLGRQFVLDADRIEDGQAQILLCDVGFNEALQIPTSFMQFHNEELPEYSNEALAEPFYLGWLANGGEAPSMSQCVGYRIPPTLGGKDDIQNLELADMEVYWGLLSQIHSGA